MSNRLHLEPNPVAAHLPLGPKRTPLDRIREQYPPGMERTRKLVKLLQDDAAKLGAVDSSAPKGVQAAAAAFQQAIDNALAAVAELEKKAGLALEARDADVEAAAKAIREGRPRPKELKVSRARELEEVAFIGLEAAETAVIEAHVELTNSWRASWAEWRANLVRQAVDADAQAKKAADRLAQLLEQRRQALLGVLEIDRQVTGRYREARQGAEGDLRHGVKVFRAAVAAHFHSTDLEPNRFKAVREALAVVESHLSQETPWLTEWTPAGDPQHDELLQEPLDLTAQWVRDAILPDGMTCPDCGRRLPDNVEIDPQTLRPVHQCTVKGRRLVRSGDGFGHVWA